MPRAVMSQAHLLRQTQQMVAAQARDVAGAVEAVAEQASALQVSIDLIDDSVDGGLVETLNAKLAELDTRITALEP